MNRAFPALCGLALMLAACNGDQPAPSEEEADAAGEVLGGTISDDMLPLDRVRSESPRLRTTSDTSGDADASATGGPATDGETGQGEGADAEATPAAPANEGNASAEPAG